MWSLVISEEFQSFANDRPEYAPLFVAFQTHQSENISSKPSVTVTKTNGTTLPTKNDQEHVKSEWRNSFLVVSDVK